MRTLLIVGLLLSSGCRDSAFQTATRLNTLDGWKRFIADNPKDDGVDAAQQRMEELAFADAQKAHTVVAYKRFLLEYPEAEKAPTVKKLLEALRFNAAMERKTAHSLRQFLRGVPDRCRRGNLGRVPAIDGALRRGGKLQRVEHRVSG